MRRVLSHGSFLRFYLLLGLALCVVFLIALGGRSFIEQVRREDYREQLAALPMSMMTQRLASVAEEERDALLGELSERLGMQLALRRMADTPLGYFERSRIERGRVLVAESPGNCANVCRILHASMRYGCWKRILRPGGAPMAG